MVLFFTTYFWDYQNSFQLSNLLYLNKRINFITLSESQLADYSLSQWLSWLSRNGKDLNRNFPTWRELNTSRAELKERDQPTTTFNITAEISF